MTNAKPQATATARTLTPLIAGVVILIFCQLIILRAFQQQAGKLSVYRSQVMLSRDGYQVPAEAESRKAIKLNRFDGYAWFNLGSSVYQQKRFEEARSVLRSSLEYLPHSYNALRLIAFSDYRLQDFAAAAEQFSGYLEMMPNPEVTPDLVFTMAGLASLRTGDLANADYNLLLATPLSTDKSDILRARIMTGVFANQPLSAELAYRLFMFYLPKEELNPFEMVANGLRSGQGAQVVQFLEMAYGLNPDDLSNLKALAAAYAATNQRPKAEALVSKAVEKHPQSASLRLVYGDLLYAQKQYQEAFAQYDEHLRLQPNSPLKGDIENKKAAPGK